MSLTTRPPGGTYLSNSTMRGVAFVVSHDQGQDYHDYDTGEDIEVLPPDDQVVAIMVGDDRRHTLDLEDCDVLEEDGFCCGCGQIGCPHG